MGNQAFNRREFLKFLLMLPAAARLAAGQPVSRSLLFNRPQSDHPNILIFLFDTLSARNISLYGYPRDTMPNLARFAEKATVYHQHHSAGNWTPTGTSSLLTGTYPWTHRNFALYSQVLDSFSGQNMFSLLNKIYYTLANTQNPLVQSIFHQYRSEIDELTNPEESGVLSFRPEGDLFNEDYNFSSWGQNIVQGTWASPASSPFLSVLYEIIYTIRYNRMAKNLADVYPYWISTISPGMYVFLDQAVTFLEKTLPDTPRPTLGYIHLFPPHAPYAPRMEFSTLFDDGWLPPEKPSHVFTDGSSTEYLNTERKKYDQFIANIDHDFSKIIDQLEASGMMEDSYIIFTSDHGDLLERGVWGHVNPLLYEPLTHIPLLIHEPGQTTRQDVFAPTSAVDLLPTLCKLSGIDIPAWIEGELLPNFREDPPDPQRPIFSVEAKKNSKFGPLTIATVAMIKWPYKLIHYFGYEELPFSFELYNLANDPEELEDLYPASPEIAAELQSQLLEKLEQVNQTTGRGGGS